MYEILSKQKRPQSDVTQVKQPNKYAFISATANSTADSSGDSS